MKQTTNHSSVSTALRCSLVIGLVAGYAAYGQPFDRPASSALDNPGIIGASLSESQRALYVRGEYLAEGTADETVEMELADLESQIAGMLHRIDDEDEESLFSKRRRKVVITYLGKGRLRDTIDDSAYAEVPGREYDAQGMPPKIAEEPAPGHSDLVFSFDAFSLQSSNEFRIMIPRETLERVGEEGELLGLHLGSHPGEASAEAEDPLNLKSWSNGVDNRTRRGTNGVAFTSGTFSKMVDAGGCSGVLVGPKHTLSAAHCVWDRDTGSWQRPTLRAGRSGSAWAASASTSSNTWFWTPSGYRTASSDSSARKYDIGMWVTHSSRMGDTPGIGWMGWYWWSSNSTFASKTKYNRGYPSCSSSRLDRPSPCTSNNLYGDTNSCTVGNYSSKDSNGHYRRFMHSCDASGGQSGSPLYHYLNGTTLVVVGVHTSSTCGTTSSNPCTSSDVRPLGATRITKEYSDSINWLRQTFP